MWCCSFFYCIFFVFCLFSIEALTLSFRNVCVFHLPAVQNWSDSLQCPHDGKSELHSKVGLEAWKLSFRDLSSRTALHALNCGVESAHVWKFHLSFTSLFVPLCPSEIVFVRISSFCFCVISSRKEIRYWFFLGPEKSPWISGCQWYHSLIWNSYQGSFPFPLFCFCVCVCSSQCFEWYSILLLSVFLGCLWKSSQSLPRIWE